MPNDGFRNRMKTFHSWKKWDHLPLLDFGIASESAWIFSAASKYFIVRRRLFFFFPTTKHPKVRRLAFDRAQVLEWVLRNNCNCYLVLFLHILDKFDYPKVRPFFEVPRKHV